MSILTGSRLLPAQTKAACRPSERHPQLTRTVRLVPAESGCRMASRRARRLRLSAPSRSRRLRHRGGKLISLMNAASVCLRKI